MQKVLLILGELSDDDIDWIIATGHRKEIGQGQILIHEGQPVDALYLVLEGRLGVSVAALGGEQIACLISGDMVGEMSFVDARPPSATVTTLEPCLVLAIARDRLAERLDLDVGFASRFYRALAMLLSNRLRVTVQHLGSDRDEAVHVSSENLSDNDSENIALARVRFDWMLRRLRSGAIDG